MLRAIWLTATLLSPAATFAGPSNICSSFFDEFAEGPMLGEGSGGMNFLTTLDGNCAWKNLGKYGDRFADVLIENGILEYFDDTTSAYLSRAVEAYYAGKLRPLYLDAPLFRRMLDQVDKNFDALPEERQLQLLQAVHFLGVGYIDTLPLLQSWRRYDPDLASQYQPVFMVAGVAKCADEKCSTLPEALCTPDGVQSAKSAFYTAPDKIEDWLNACKLGIGKPETPIMLRSMRESGILDARCSETVQYNALFSKGFAAAQNCDSLIAQLPELSAASSTDLVAVKRYGERLVQSGRMSEADFQRILGNSSNNQETE